MREPTPEFPKLIELFNLETKRELERYCSRFTLYKTDLVALILAARQGVLYPYRYSNHFERRLPKHLFPNEDERNALAENGVGSFKTKHASKFTSKLFQLHKEQRALAAHLLYTPDYRYWYIFCFDNRDTLQSRITGNMVLMFISSVRYAHSLNSQLCGKR